MSETKNMDLKDFQDLGFIQEINRVLLHPCGLALSLPRNINEDGSIGEVAGHLHVIDKRDDPEGFLFLDDYMSSDECKEKIDNVLEAMRDRADARKKLLPFDRIVQPAHTDKWIHHGVEALVGRDNIKMNTDKDGGD